MDDRIIHHLLMGEIMMKAIRTDAGLFFRLTDGRSHVVDLSEMEAKVFADFVRASVAINPNG